jgi:micrococcal nuclease
MKLKRISIFLLILLILGALSYYKTPTTGNVIINNSLETTKVLKVIDGDTLETELGTIRLLGINTPEKNFHGYEQAKQFLKPLENQTIQLQKDKENKDKYNRFLRYAIYNNRNLNIEIAEHGLATIYMTKDLALEEKFQRAQQQAKQAQLGLWQQSNNKCSQCISLIELDPQNEFFILKNICTKTCNLAGWYAKDAGRNIFHIPNLESNQQITINSTKHVWNNDHDEFFLRDENGLLVIYYSY